MASSKNRPTKASIESGKRLEEEVFREQPLGCSLWRVRGSGAAIWSWLGVPLRPDNKARALQLLQKQLGVTISSIILWPWHGRQSLKFPANNPFAAIAEKGAAP
jgi:hypothetical protein